eukprot:CAMPEP_0195516308 /NCGR_PEP_ID=MMETSP0794_2-20130614/7071_1 /TAXON_ID=515487 /ORGANISM="Stephanopyxis turris, Strain CCMP 815" /LENGTH=190 /DNA_ID=CAMNT_0040644869 /DNA_START=99 /DNA_END=671 /DNA_ORIENTATION=+
MADKQTPNLSGEKVTLVSKSGGKFELAKEIAEQAQLIRNIIAVPNDGDGGGSGSGSGSGSDDAAAGNVEVPVRVVEDDILAKVISFMTHHFDNPMQEIEKPIPSDKMEDIASDPFDRVFVDVGQETLFNLISAANFLDIPPLLDLTCAKVATMLKGKTPEQVKEAFNIEGAFTPEEEAKVNGENPWLEEL